MKFGPLTRSSCALLATLLASTLACTDDGPATPSETDTGESGTSSDTGQTDTDQPLECEPEDPDAGWLWWLVDGVFPNDVPNDVDETCTVLESAEPVVMALDCPFAALELRFDLSPAVPLPEPGATAQLRLHHEPGWLNWPDLWIDVEVDGGDHYAMQASSVLQPTVGAYAVPWSPMLAEGTCGPFVAMDPFAGEDPCGEQLAKQIGYEVDGETVTAWHGTHVATSINGRAFEAWTSTAREYLAPPETCDVSPSWYSLVTRRQGAG